MHPEEGGRGKRLKADHAPFLLHANIATYMCNLKGYLEVHSYSVKMNKTGS